MRPHLVRDIRVLSQVLKVGSRDMQPQEVLQPLIERTSELAADMLRLLCTEFSSGERHPELPKIEVFRSSLGGSESPLGVRALEPLEAGRLLCFYPGRVYEPDEPQLPSSDKIMSNEYEAIYYDGAGWLPSHLKGSELLAGSGRSLWHGNRLAIGNLLNHPPKGALPSAVPMAARWPSWQEIGQETPALWARLLPYVAMWDGKVVRTASGARGSGEKVWFPPWPHTGLAFLAARGLEPGEELFFNYRMHARKDSGGPAKFPDWYHPVDEQAFERAVLQAALGSSAVRAMAEEALEEELEPVTLLPGRRRAVTADLSAALEHFERHLGSGKAASSHQPSLPAAGAFPAFRSIFRERGLATVVEKQQMELGRDLFQFVAGVCWELFFAAKALERRVGVVFLAYLLYHCQGQERCPLPVDAVLLEAFGELREECERRRLFLECPKVLQRMATEGALSVGVGRACRNLWFERGGKVTERLGVAEAPKAAALPVQRLSLSGERPALLAQSGRPLIDFKEAVREAEAYDAGTGESSAIGPQLEDLATKAASYAKQRPPAPHDVLVQASEALPEAFSSAPRRPKRRLVVESSEESADSLVEELGGFPQDAERQDLKKGKPTRLRSKGARQSQLLGLRRAMERSRAGASAKPPLEGPAAQEAAPPEALPEAASEAAPLEEQPEEQPAPWADGEEEGPRLQLPASPGGEEPAEGPTSSEDDDVSMAAEEGS